jgi:hypothetical protein
MTKTNMSNEGERMAAALEKIADEVTDLKNVGSPTSHR